MNNELKNETPEALKQNTDAEPLVKVSPSPFTPSAPDSAGKPDSPEGACDCLDNFD
jgi:hypothetical protein